MEADISLSGTLWRGVAQCKRGWWRVHACNRLEERQRIARRGREEEGSRVNEEERERGRRGVQEDEGKGSKRGTHLWLLGLASAWGASHGLRQCETVCESV
eukprot:1393981-Rhodomonas_salina.1